MKCYTIAVPNCPDPVVHPVQAKRFADFLNGLDGLLGVHPHYPEGTILFFDTVEHAKNARMKFMAEGNKCGDYIMNAEITENGATVSGIAERVGGNVQ